MTPEQQDFISEVILPKLVEMAIDGSLPTDMNEMCYSHFEDEAEEYNKVEVDTKEVTDAMIDKAYLDYLSMEREDIVRVLNEVNSDPNVKGSDMLDTCHDDLQVIEKFEHTFTVGTFFNQLR